MPGIPNDVLKVLVQHLQPALLILGVHEDMRRADDFGLVEQILPSGATDFWKRVRRGSLHPLEPLRNF